MAEPFVARWRLESAGGQHKLIDLVTGQDLSKVVASVTLKVEFQSMEMTVTAIDGTQIEMSNLLNNEVSAEIPADIKPVKFREWT